MSLGPITLAAAGALVAATVSAGAAADPALLGRWATPTGGVVAFGPCASPGPGAFPCGRIAALGGPPDRERLDTRNPDAGLRRRQVLGLEIVSGLRPKAAGVWTVDALYNPDDGRTYSGAIQLRGEDRLELKGCALKVFCQTQVWSRLP